MPTHRTLKRGLLLSFNAALILSLLFSINGFHLVDKRGLLSPGIANAAVIPDNSLAYNFKLTGLKLTDGNQATVFNTQSGPVSLQAALNALQNPQSALSRITAEGSLQASFWLVKSADQVLNGAAVRIQIPLLGFDQVAGEISPGQYMVDLSERLVVTPDFTNLSAQTMRGWQADVRSLTLNGQSLNSTSLTDYLPNIDLTVGGRYEIPLTFAATARILDANNQPVANQTLAAQLSLPDNNYTETVSLTTDGAGLATYQRVEHIILTINGGQIQQLAAPLNIEGASAETIHLLDGWDGSSSPTATPGPSPTATPPPTATPLAGVCLSVTTSMPAYKVGEDAQIRGKVTDCRGANISGASVTVRSVDPNNAEVVNQTVSSDIGGNFTVAHRAQLPYGTYTATANASYNNQSDTASVSYQVSASINTALTLKLSTGGEAYTVTVPLKDPLIPVTYNVYQRGHDTISTDISVSPSSPLSAPTDVRVMVALYKADKNGVIADFPTFSEQRTLTVSNAAVTLSPAVQFPLPGLLPVGYYKVRAVAFTASGQSTIMGESTVDVAIIFNPPPEMTASFVVADTARYWPGGNNAASYSLHQGGEQESNGTVLKFALDAADGVSDEVIATQKLFTMTQFLVTWVGAVKKPSFLDDTLKGLQSKPCNINNTSDPANKDCVAQGLTQCSDYADYLTAFLRAVAIPARPVTGGAFGRQVGAKDIDEYLETPTAPLNFDGLYPDQSGYLETDYNVTDWGYHVWTEVYLNGNWWVYDANQNYPNAHHLDNTQNGYGTVWIDDWRTKLYNANLPAGQPTYAPNSLPSGGIIADKNGGSEESLEDFYLATPTPTPSPTTENLVAQSSGLQTASPTNGLDVQFESPVTHLTQDITFSVQVTNTTATTWSGDLQLNLTGSPITNPMASTSLRPQPVWHQTESVSLAPGDSLTRRYVVPYTNYQAIGSGKYFLEAQALDQTAQAWTMVGGATALDVQVPASSRVGEPITITAIVSNPTTATIHDVQLTDRATDLETQNLGDLAPNASTTLTWTFIPGSQTAGLYSISLLAQTADGGMTSGGAQFMLLAPAQLKLQQLDIPERIEVGQNFEIAAHLWNPGSDPINDITVTFTPDTAALFTLDDPASAVVDTLQANGWATLTWHATALQPGQLSAHIEASSGSLYANRSFATLIAEPGHAVDLLIDNVGDNTQQGEVIRQVPTGIGNNYAQAGYTVVVQNQGSLTDTVEISVVPGDGGVAAFGDETIQFVAQTVSLAPGTSTELSLNLRTWGDEATALVSVKSQSDPSQSDQMRVRVVRNDEQALAVEPAQLDFAIQHGHSGSGTLQVSNHGEAELDHVTLTPEGTIAAWMQLETNSISQLAPGQTISVNLTVNVPKYQAPGDYAGGVRVHSGIQTEAVSVSVQVPESHTALVSIAPGTLAVIPGHTGLYQVTVQNTGNITDTFDLAVQGLPNSWETTLSPDASPTLKPGASANRDLLIIPLRSPDTKPQTHTFTVTASNTQTSASDQANLEVLAFHDVDLNIDKTQVISGAPIIITKAWKKAHDHPTSRLDVIILTHGAPTAANENTLVGHGASVRRRFTLVNAIAATIPADKLTEIAGEPFVARIELDEQVTAVENLQADVGPLNISGLRSAGFNGAGVVVAIVDTGVDTHNAALPYLTAGYDFVNNDADPNDDNGHGTHVAGIIGSNDSRAPGVAPGAMLMPVKALDAAGSGSSSNVIAGIEWAVTHGANEINLSLGTGSAGDGDSALSQAVDNAVKSGVIVLVAAGNSGPTHQTISSPGDARLAITVGALNTSTTVADFSSRGPTLDGRVKPDLLAPGTNISSTWIGGGFQTKSGTSMATPHVAGVAALLLNKFSVTPALVKEALTTSAVSLSGYDSNTQGHGRVDGDAAAAYIHTKHSSATTQTLPGGTAVYTYTLTNLGNVSDSFGLSTHADNLPPAALTYPIAISATWVQLSSSPVALASDARSPITVRVAVPANWAGMRTTPYRFRLAAVSQAEPAVGDTELAFVSVQATKRSKIEYTKLEIGWLRSTVSALSNSNGLIAKLDAAAAKVQDALTGLVAGDLIRTNTSLDSAINQMSAFVQAVNAQRGKQLDATTADRLVANANLILAHLRDARTTPTN